MKKTVFLFFSTILLSVPASSKAAAPAGDSEFSPEAKEAFYRSLPLAYPPFKVTAAMEMEMDEIPREVYSGGVFNYTGSFYAFKGVRLPEKEDLRFILVTMEDDDGEHSTALFTFDSQMNRIDYHYLGLIQPVDGGNNVFVISSEISKEMEMTFLRLFTGRGEGGKPVEIVFEKQFITVLPDGNFNPAEPGFRKTTDYIRQGDDGKSGENPYRFTVTEYDPVVSIKTGEQSIVEHTTRYLINAEGELVKVKSFD